MRQLLPGLLLAAAELPEGGIMDFANLPAQLLIQLFNVSVLTVVLVLVLYKPVKKFMADRTARIQAEIENADRLRDEAMELKDKYQKLLDGIEAEREEILRSTHKQAVEKSDKLLFDARREIDVLYSRAMAELEEEKKRRLDEMKEQMIEISHLMASRFVRVSIDRKTQDEFIEQALADWDGGVLNA